MDKKVRVGLVGYGFAGKVFHAHVITSVPQLYLAKVVERRTMLSKERYPWVEVVQDLQDVLQDSQIELVVIATPTYNHFQLAQEALLADKHVVIDKPFTTTTEEADKLITLAKERGKMLSVYHNRRWDGDFLTVKEMVDNGVLGRVTEADMRWDRFQPLVDLNRWREQERLGSGILFDLGVHLFDQALRLFGYPKEVLGHVDILREGGKADDFFEVTLFYEQLKVKLTSSKMVRQPGPRYRLNGTRGSFVKYGLDPQEGALISGATPSSANWGEEEEEHWGILHTEMNGLEFKGKVKTKPGAYDQYYQDIYESIVTGKEPQVKAEEARDTIRIVELAKESYAQKKIVPFS